MTVAPGEPATLGEHLAFGLHEQAASPTGPWRRMTGLLRAPHLRQRVVNVQRRLRAPGGPPVELRVAASTTHLGIAARLVAAHIGARALGYAGLRLAPDAVWVADDGHGPLHFSFTTAESADPLRDNVIEQLTDQIRTAFRVSDRVLWGNVGSAANSTVTLMRLARPDLVAAAAGAADAVLADPRIDGGTLTSGPRFRRRSCCLIYRAAATREAICGDCVLGG